MTDKDPGRTQEIFEFLRYQMEQATETASSNDPNITVDQRTDVNGDEQFSVYHDGHPAVQITVTKYGHSEICNQGIDETLGRGPQAEVAGERSN